MGLSTNALLEVFEVFETKDLAAAHEVHDLASGAIDGVHADEVGFFIDADRIEAVIDIGLHGGRGCSRGCRVASPRHGRGWWRYR